MVETYDQTEWEVIVRRAFYDAIAIVALAQTIDFVPPEQESSDAAAWCRPSIVSPGVAPSRRTVHFAMPVLQVDVFIRKASPENWIQNAKIAEAFRKVVNATRVALLDSDDVAVGWLTFYDADLTYMGIEETNHRWMIEVRTNAQV